MPSVVSKKRNLTDQMVDREPLAPAGGHRTLRDSDQPGLEVRITSGAKSFSVYVRDPVNGKPVRRAIGSVKDFTVDQAREIAREWRIAIRQGRDPKLEARLNALEKAAARATTVEAVFADFAAEKLTKERRGDETKRVFEREVIPTLGPLAVTEVTDDQIAAIIKRVVRRGANGNPAPVQARNLLGTVKRFFQWAVDQRAYGLKISPCLTLKPNALCGEDSKVVRDRTLDDDEVRALWQATFKINPVKGAAYRLLMLTGLRRNEVADAERSEIKSSSERGRHWIISAERMKGRNYGKGKARAHVVPLTPEMVAIFDGQPHFRDGRYIFSTTHGEKSISLDDKTKRALDEAMLAELREIKQERGDDISKLKLTPWRNHDIRRTVRTNLSRLRIPEEVREAILAHKLTGIKAHYDVHDYYEEKRDALVQWASRLKHMCNQTTNSTVVPLRTLA